MKLMTMTAATAVLAFFAEPAAARTHQHWRMVQHDASNNINAIHHLTRHDTESRTYATRRIARHYADRSGSGRTYAATGAYSLAPSNEQSSGYGARPAAWCGWEMRHLVSKDPGPSYNLASNWAHWGHSGPAGVGAVVVWSHHVGEIVGREDGMWVIKSGNDGHQIRTRARSIAGAIAIRWG